MTERIGFMGSKFIRTKRMPLMVFTVYTALTRRTTGGLIFVAIFFRHTGHLNVPSISSHLLFGETAPQNKH
jgi:hypothetical protein